MSLTLRGTRMLRCRVSFLRFPGAGRDPFPPWAPAPCSLPGAGFAGVTEFDGGSIDCPLSPELAVIGDHIIGQIEVDASATALRGAKLSQSPLSRLVVGVVFRPSGRSGEPAQFGEPGGQEHVADQPAAIDTYPVAESGQSVLQFPKVGNDARQLIGGIPRAIDPEIYRAASRLRVFGGKGERSLGVLAPAQRRERGKLVVMVLKNDGGLEAVG